MSKIFRWLGIAAFTLAVLVVAAMTLFAKQLVELAASHVTGRQVHIAGMFDLDYGRYARLKASRVSLANPEWSEKPSMLTIEALTVSLDLRSLLAGRVVLPELRLQSPVLFLEKTDQGPVNWNFSTNETGQASDGAMPPALAAIHQVEIRNGRVIYRDYGNGMHVVATIDALVGHLVTGCTNKSDGFLGQARRGPQR